MSSNTTTTESPNTSNTKRKPFRLVIEGGPAVLFCAATLMISGATIAVGTLAALRRQV